MTAAKSFTKVRIRRILDQPRSCVGSDAIVGSFLAENAAGSDLGVVRDGMDQRVFNHFLIRAMERTPPAALGKYEDRVWPHGTPGGSVRASPRAQGGRSSRSAVDLDTANAMSDKSPDLIQATWAFKSNVIVELLYIFLQM